MINNNTAPAQQAAPAVTTASTVVPNPAPAAAPVSNQDIMLPKTGPENMIVGGIGLASLVFAGAAYLNSRRELVKAFLNR